MTQPLFAFGMPGVQEIAAISAITIVISFINVVPLWLICKKAGFHPLISLLALIPYFNILLLFYLAFTKWPVLMPPRAVTRARNPYRTEP
jgi:hypothetical protein